MLTRRHHLDDRSVREIRLNRQPHAPTAERSRLERSAVEDITPFLPGDTVAYLRIADGDRKFPFRPIASGLFLIGHGRSCDLRLGNKDVPAIHSVVQINARNAEITRVGSSPELVVNGEEVVRCDLHHGDVIEIGNVRCVFALCHPEADSVTVKLAEPAPAKTATDLVDRIETEFLMIDSQDSNRDRVLSCSLLPTRPLTPARSRRRSDWMTTRLRRRPLSRQSRQQTPSSSRIFEPSSRDLTRSAACSNRSFINSS